jgi:5-methylcytosine-specific restriction endonuclease McrA
LIPSHIEKWLTGEIRGGTDLGLSPTIRQYLIEQAGGACTLCGFNKTHPIDGTSVLEVEHIDGDGANHSPSNVTVICPNCHALTPTYRGRNVGHGRPVSYHRTVRL